MKLNRYQHPGEVAYKIYQHVGPGPFTVKQAEQALGKTRIGRIMGGLREDKIAVHHSEGSHMPMVRKRGEERVSPEWYFTPWAIRKFEEWIKEEQCEGVKE